MAFPATTPNQDLTKILEDIQIKKQQLQKGANSTSPPGFANLYTPSSVFSSPQYTANNAGTQLPNDGSVNVVAKGVWNQAINQSFGSFIPQDSVFGNCILPVLPRYDNATVHYTSPTKN
ncbi:SOSS complex subunit C homolog B [Anopheles cruzii]|uniref:SOSS complex subunit C homolog B n=1 Tax=Anopheles cruzii TaxID=68878 RepID=UPI0022EC5491|nr:SOSS complex subunit C homolog B [Anopheles cruzii]